MQKLMDSSGSADFYTNKFSSYNEIEKDRFNTVEHNDTKGKISIL